MRCQGPVEEPPANVLPYAGESAAGCTAVCPPQGRSRRPTQTARFTSVLEDRHSAPRGSPLWTTGTSHHEGAVLHADEESISTPIGNSFFPVVTFIPVDGFVRTLDAFRSECWTGSDQNSGPISSERLDGFRQNLHSLKRLRPEKTAMARCQRHCGHHCADRIEALYNARDWRRPTFRASLPGPQ
jgi:hypothetical protein